MAQLNETSGVITSPFFPRRYPNNQDCNWQITANKGNRVKLVIDKSMDIFECFLCSSCDSLKIQNAYKDNGAASGTICGKPNPKKDLIYYSVLESLKLQFISDAANEMQSVGFKATYTLLNVTPPGKCQPLIYN